MIGYLLQGRYQIIQALSTGGFCQTYIAQDVYRPNNPTCVVKYLQSDSNHLEFQQIRQLFINEVQALRKLKRYCQVPRLLDQFEDQNKLYLVQEFIDGHPLHLELQPGQRWSESQVVQLLREILVILEFVHCHGLIHRDIKPSNLIRRKRDNRLVLIDFGSVKQTWVKEISQGKTNTATFGIPITIAIGTPGYMPLEQERGRPRRNSDIYALGMIGIQALTGVAPAQLLAEADTGELIWRHQANVSEFLASVLNKMVRYHFKDRYQSAIEALQALQPLARTRIKPPAIVISPVEETHTSSYFVESAPVPTYSGISTTLSFLLASNKYTLLIGIVIGVVSTMALVVGVYYYLQPPAPALRIQQYSINIESEKTAS